ncbi:hypothetical protein GGS24DRAFT_513812 [Hypoxylon argillaceum]|nr:hypothetical protein GGS24DRAFT_513812 [Hypoxylon argillaceum]
MHSSFVIDRFASMSQSDQPLPHGWLQHKHAVEKMLSATAKGNYISALYLHGPPTSGLSTSLVDFVVQQAEAGLAPRRVVYVTGTELDQQYVGALPSIQDKMGNNDYSYRFTIKSAKQFCQDCEKGKTRIDNDLVLMLDVRMSPTVAEEIMFALVLEDTRDAILAKKRETESHIAIFLLGSSWFSERTFTSFEKLMQTTRRSIQDTYPPVRSSNPSLEELDNILGQALKGGRRVVFSKPDSWNPFSVCSQVASYRGSDGRPLALETLPREGCAARDRNDISRSLCLQVDPTSLFSTPTDVSIVLSGDHVLSDVLDPVTSQLVRVQRRLTRCELENAMAWAQRSTVPAQLLTSYAPESLEGLEDGDECLGPAWSTRLMSLVLQTIHMLGGNGNRRIREFAIRIPANHVAWADRCRRLSVLGCLKQNPDKEGAYLLTDRGHSMLRLTKHNDLEWGVAWLLMSASGGVPLDTSSRRVLVCMASILAGDPSTFVSKAGTRKADGSPYTESDLRRLCAPIVRPCATHGMLWLYTGIFLRQQNAPLSNAVVGANTPQPDPYIVISTAKAEEIADLCNTRFAGLCGLSLRGDGYWTETVLTKEQVFDINKVLMWAFLHRTVYFERETRDRDIRGLTNDTYLVTDCVSLGDVQVKQDKEFLDIQRWRAHGNIAAEGGGFYAIYNQLVLGDKGGQYLAKGLTRLPISTLQIFEKESGGPWPELVMRSSD